MELTGNEGYRLQPRINVRRDVSPAASPQVASSTINVVSRMFGRSSDSKCEENPNLNTCEKPASVSTPMIVAVVVYVHQPPVELWEPPSRSNMVLTIL